MIIGRDGQASVNPPLQGSWEARETAVGGGESCRAVIANSEYQKARHVYQAGAEWYAFRAQNARLDFYGKLNEPAITGGTVTLSARGPATKLDREVQSLLVYERGCENWVVADSEPHHYDNNKWIEVDVRAGRIKFIPQADQSYSGGEVSWALFWFPQNGQDRLTKWEWTPDKSENDSGWEIVVKGVNTDASGVGAAMSSDLQTWTMGAGTADGTEQTLSISGDYDLIAVGLRKVGAGTPSNPPRFSVTKSKVYGIADSTDYSWSDFMREICSRIGVDDSEIQGDGTPVGPFKIERQTWREIVEYGCMVTNKRLIIRKTLTGFVGDYGRFDQRVWTIPLESPRDILPQERFNKVGVVFKWAGGNALDIAYARADPDPLEYTRLAPIVELSGNQPRKDDAKDIAQKMADFLSRPHYTGTIRAAYVYDDMGVQRSAQDVRAGDAAYLPELGIIVPIYALTRREVDVEIELPTDYPFLERINARRERKAA